MTDDMPIKHYISNKEFSLAIIEYIDKCKILEDEGKDIPPIPDDIAKQFVVLATKLGSRYNFAGYSYRDDMVSDAIFACCAKIRKFDYNISTNAFAYFTNVCWRAMVDVINFEAKMSYIKAKMHQSLDYDQTLDDNDMSDFSEQTDSMNDTTPFFDIQEFEKKMSDRKEKAKLSPRKTKLTSTVLDLG